MQYSRNLVAAAALCNTLLGSYAQVTTSCNPLKAACPNDRGLPSSVYSVDFTSINTLPPEWILADFTKVNLGASGAELTFNKRYDAPTMQTNFNFFYGRVEYVVKAAPGTGIISSMVLLSDDLDEIDWEFRGGITDSIQTNYFGKGYTGTYNRSTTVPISTPQASFHTYALDWSAESLIWSIDGKTVRTLRAADADGNGSQYPQTPMKVSLSLWDAGDPDTNPATVEWAGGYTPLPPPQPYSMYIKSVKIWNANPGQQYQYTDRSGSSKSIKIVNETVTSSSSSAMRSTETLSLAPTASVSNGTSVSTATVPVQTPKYLNSTSIGNSLLSMSTSSCNSAVSSTILVSSSLIPTVPAQTTNAPYSGSTEPSSFLTSISSCNSTVTISTQISSFVPDSSQVPPTPTAVAPDSTSVVSTSSCNSTVAASSPMSSTVSVYSSVVSSTVSPVSSSTTETLNSTYVEPSLPLLSTSSCSSTDTDSDATPIMVPISTPVTSAVGTATSYIPVSSTSTSSLLTSTTAAGASYGSSAVSPYSSASGSSAAPYSDSVAANKVAVTTSTPTLDAATPTYVQTLATNAPATSTTPQVTTGSVACGCTAVVSSIQPAALGADSNATTSQSVMSSASLTPSPSDGSDETKPDNPSTADSDSPADDDSVKEVTDTRDSNATTTVYNYRTTSTSTITNAGATSWSYPWANTSIPTNGSVASTGAPSTGATGSARMYTKSSISPAPFPGDAAKVRVTWNLPVIAGTVAGLLLLL